MRLNYEVPERAPTSIQLVTTPDRLTLTFPLSPTWPRQAATIAAFAIAAIYIAGLAFIAWRDRALAANSPTLHHATGICLSLAALWAVLGAFTLRASRRRRHLPRTLIADGVARTLLFRAERSTRWRQWPLPNPADVCIYPPRTRYRSEHALSVLLCLKGFGFPKILLTFPPRDAAIAYDFITEMHRLATGDLTPESN